MTKSTKKNARWTKEDIKSLLDLVKDSKTKGDAFEGFAKTRGTSKEAVQAKYYGLLANKKATTTRRAPNLTTLPDSIQLAAASNEALVKLAHDVKTEIGLRQTALNELNSIFS